MFETGLVFIIGTSFSFFPLLWLLNRLGRAPSSRIQAAAEATPVAPEQEAFIATLKQEGFERAVNAIELIRQDLERRLDAFSAAEGHRGLNSNCGGPEIPLLTRERLSECVSLVESLFSPRTARRFRRAIDALEADYRESRQQWVNHAGAAVGLLRSELSDRV